MFVELTEAAGESRNPIRRIIGGLGEVVWAQWDKVRHAAARLVAGLAAFRCGKSGSGGVKPSWFKTALKGAPVAGSIWLAFRARSR